MPGWVESIQANSAGLMYLEQRKEDSRPDAAHEPPPAAAVRQESENMNTKPESEAPADGGGR